MKNVSSLKSTKTESPKTPGGISKSLLTPCRRLGLSRNYKKAGPAPFISPLSGSSSTKEEVKVEKKEPRKRKKCVEAEEHEEESETSSNTRIVEDGILDCDEGDILKTAATEADDLSSTPTRQVEIPRKKKSKTLLSALSKNNKTKSPLKEKQPEEIAVEAACKAEDDAKNDKKGEENVIVLPKKSKSKKSPRTSKSSTENVNIDVNEPKNDIDNLENKLVPEEINTETENIVTPLQKTKTKSSTSKKVVASQKSPRNLNMNTHKSKDNDNAKIQDNSEEKTSYSIKPKSPNDLTKECIVVIQKKIFKTDKNKIQSEENNLNTQAVFDSDSDDVPLNQLNKDNTSAEHINKETKAIENYINENKTQPKTLPNELENEIVNLDDENEHFVEPKRTKVKKLADKSTSIGGLKKKLKLEKPKPSNPVLTPDDDEDDFDFDNKKTILIRKTYEKVSKPQKAKTTGSITQRDIDELKARIESKKKLLLARAMTEDTEELRSLIKKWQKGCQDALMELMVLMKNKFPDKQNMDYSEMLSMLKIPTNLVGYDEENDCFNTPDDANIVLSNFNDL